MSLKAFSGSTSFQQDDRPPGDLLSTSINLLLRAFSLGAREPTFAILAPPRIDTFPFESDSGTMRKVLKWGVVPLNLEGHGMDPHSFSWAKINSPEYIRDFNHTTTTKDKGVVRFCWIHKTVPLLQWAPALASVALGALRWHSRIAAFLHRSLSRRTAGSHIHIC